MTEKYQYLKKYIKNYGKPTENCFTPVTITTIRNAETNLGIEFPKILKGFWQEVGYGILNTKKDGTNAFDFANCILSPKGIAGILTRNYEDCYATPEVGDLLKDGDIPFFEVGDSSDFFVLKPKSEKPEAVYDLFGNIVEESFERFIWRLYHESPTFYINVKN